MAKKIMLWIKSISILPIILVILTGCAKTFDNDHFLFDDGDSYYNSDAAGYIETEYASSGPYTTAQKSITDYTIFYPKQMDGDHPIITWGNGTGASIDSYVEFLKHLASWGFVVIASESGKTGSGEEMIEGIDYLLIQNVNPDSVFYRQLDPENIGTIGHSQGGGGAINAATDSRVTCAVPIAPAQGEIEDVRCPIFLVAGSIDIIVPAHFVRSTSYNPADAPTIFGIVQNMGHLDFTGNLGKARGYITAWLMYQLKDDEFATQAFVGDCEIGYSRYWKVEKKNF